MWKNEMWRWILIASLVIAFGGLGYGLYYTTNLLHITQDELNDVKTELTNTQTELTNTQTELANTQTELANTQTELANTQTELQFTQKELETTKTELSDTSDRLVELEANTTEKMVTAKEVLHDFMFYATSKNLQEMWAMLHPDSQKSYTDQEDFISSNTIASDGYFKLDSFNIGSGKMLSEWNTYSDVAEIQVVLMQSKELGADVVLSLIPGVDFFNSLVPNNKTETVIVHLVSVNNKWNILFDKEVSSVSSTETSTPTQSSPQLDPDGVQISAHELSSNPSKYHGQTVWVRGPILSTSASSHSGAAFTLAESPGDALIYCVPFENTLLSQLSVGSVVTVQGKVDVGVFTGQIRVLDCLLVE